MSITCKNCNTSFNGNYCHECGQTADTHRLNHHFVWHDIQHGLLHFDKGIVHAAKELFTRPGHFIRDYIEGKRVNHFKPISLVIILAGIYGILAHYFHIKIVEEVVLTETSENHVTIKEINEWATLHFAWLILFTIPIRAMTTYIVFRKQGYNYYEHIVMGAYLSSQRLFLHLAAFPIDIALNNTIALQIFFKFNALIEISFSIWGHTQFFNKLPKYKVILLSLLSWIFFISLLSISVIIALTLMNYKFVQ